MVRWRNDSHNWGAAAKLFHWAVALFIFALLGFGFLMDFIEDIGTRITVLQFHKSFGLVLLVLAIARLRMAFGEPGAGLAGDDGELGEASCAKRPCRSICPHFCHACSWVSHEFCFGLSHNVFESIRHSQPGGGGTKIFKIYWQLFTGYCAFALIAVLAAHIGAALRHHFILRDDILIRMFPRRDDVSDTPTS